MAHPRTSSDIDVEQSLENDETTISTRVQMHGILQKKPFTAGSSKKWQKRFFIVKEGFLLYYSDSEAAKYEKTMLFNTHPKGVVPLGGCTVMSQVDGQQKYAIRITHKDFKGNLVLAAKSEESHKKWLKVLMDSGKVTWNNALLGEKVIQTLEEESSKLSKEKQEYIDKLKSEADALQEEKGKKEELKALASKLEEEKKSIEEAAKNLRLEKDSTDQELQATLDTMKKIEADKDTLEKLSEDLKANLESVSAEKSQKEKELEKMKEEAQILSEEKEKAEAELDNLKQQAVNLDEEKKKLEDSTSQLKHDIESLAENQKLLEEEKQKSLSMLKERESEVEYLAEEKKKTSSQLESLAENQKLLEEEKQKSLSMLKERESEVEYLAEEKKKTSSQLETERAKRRKAEKRLRLAEDSLKRLDRALKDSGIKIDLDIEIDVKNLRQFFEECIEEEKFAAQKLEIMREAIHAQPQYKKSVDNFVAEGDLSPEPMSPGPEGGPDIKISSEQDQPLPSNGNGASSHIEVEEQNGSH